MKTSSNVVPLPLKHTFLSVSDIPEPESPNPSLEEQIKLFPPSMELVVDLILADFDYSTNMNANTAKAVRILIIMINRINKTLENNHV